MCGGRRVSRSGSPDKTTHGAPGHALRVASRYLRDRMFLFARSDVLVDPTIYRRVILAAEQADAVLAVHRDDSPAAGVAVMFDDEGWITNIVEKPAPSASEATWNHAGVGILGPEAWQLIDRLEPSARGELKLTDALSGMLEHGAKIKAVQVHGHRFDVGNPDQLAAARELFQWQSNA